MKNPSSSLDAEVLGAYLQDYIASCPSCATDYSAPQPNSSQNASIDINGDSQETGEGVGTDEDKDRQVDVVDNSQSGCACEGACGCANNQSVLINEITIKQNEEELEVPMVN